MVHGPVCAARDDPVSPRAISSQLVSGSSQLPTACLTPSGSPIVSSKPPAATAAELSSDRLSTADSAPTVAPPLKRRKAATAVQRVQN